VLLVEGALNGQEDKPVHLVAEATACVNWCRIISAAVDGPGSIAAQASARRDDLLASG
jgi:hypothetical protein